MRLEKFCDDYHIKLSHYKTYYPKGNGMDESLDKILMRIIKKLLEDNKKA